MFPQAHATIFSHGSIAKIIFLQNLLETFRDSCPVLNCKCVVTTDNWQFKGRFKTDPCFCSQKDLYTIVGFHLIPESSNKCQAASDSKAYAFFRVCPHFMSDAAEIVICFAPYSLLTTMSAAVFGKALTGQFQPHCRWVFFVSYNPFLRLSCNACRVYFLGVVWDCLP